jgi:hypothetical protein
MRFAGKVINIQHKLSFIRLQPPKPIPIHRYKDSIHRLQVIQLWELVFAYTAAHNDPAVTKRTFR